MIETTIDTISDYLDKKVDKDTRLVTKNHALWELFMWLEEDYGITIPDETMDSFKTVGDIIDYVGKSVHCGNDKSFDNNPVRVHSQ